MSGAVSPVAGTQAMAVLESALGEIIQRALADAGHAASQAGFEIEIRARVLVGHDRARNRAEVRAVPSLYEAELRPEGGLWIVSFAGKKAHLKDFRGFRFLAELLRSPGREIHVDDLVAAIDGEARPRAGREGLEMIDNRSRAEYRRRIGELQEELSEAAANNDLGRRESLRAELDALADELRRSTGLGGRARLTVSLSERNRLNVTRSLTRVFLAISEENSVLGEHLSKCVHSGIFCSYVPDPIRPIRWKT